MKSKKWLQLVLIVAFVAVFWLYRQYDAISTDSEIPLIEVDDTQLLQVSVRDPKNVLLRGVSARDDRDGELTDKIVIESIQLLNENGLIEVSYAVADNSGNVAQTTREAQYTDYSGPKFSLTKPLIYEEHEEFDIMSAISAADVIDGDIQHRIRATSMTDESISNLGTHQIYFQVHNSIGDTSELTIPVEVVSSDRFDAELTLTDYLIYLPAGSEFQPKAYLSSFIHRDDITSLEAGLPEDFSVSVTGKVQTQNPGVYVVTYKVTKTVRHTQNADYDQTFTGYSRLIVVVEG